MILPGPDIPAYGTLSLTDELYWEWNYRYYWLKYVSQHMADLFNTGSDDFINRNWPLMSKEYKAAVWALMSASEQQRIRNVRSQV